MRNTPFTYLTCPDIAALSVLLPQAALQPFSVIYLSIEEELKLCVTHTHNLFQADNNAFFHLIDQAVLGHNVTATFASFFVLKLYVVPS